MHVYLRSYSGTDNPFMIYCDLNKGNYYNAFYVELSVIGIVIFGLMLLSNV